MSRARGPHSPIVVYADVRSITAAPPVGGQWAANQARSAMPCAPPVTTRKWSWASRITVRSERKPPLASSTGV